MPDKYPPLPHPYDDHFEEALAALDRLTPAEQLALLKEIGIVGPDGQLAPGYLRGEPVARGRPAER